MHPVLRLLLSAVLLAWLVLVLRYGFSVHDTPTSGDYAEGYNAGGALGIGFVCVVVPLLLSRIWVGKSVSAPMRAHPVIAVAAVLAGAFAVGSALSPLRPTGTDHLKADIAADCSTFDPPAFCDCFATELVERQGIDTKEELEDIAWRLRDAQQRGTAMPRKVVTAGRACLRPVV